MAKRPALTENSFLAHLFSPKKNPLPTGLRARPVVQSKGRKVARVNAYNKLPALKQEVLKRSGKRDAFLRGEVTYTDAKKALRGTAVERGVVKPVRTRAPKPQPLSKGRARSGEVAQFLMYQLRRADKDYDPATVVAGSMFIDDPDVTSLDYQGIKDRASDPDYMITVNGSSFNPYWYH